MPGWCQHVDSRCRQRERVSSSSTACFSPSRTAILHSRNIVEFEFHQQIGIYITSPHFSQSFIFSSPASHQFQASSWIGEGCSQFVLTVLVLHRPSRGGFFCFTPPWWTRASMSVKVSFLLIHRIRILWKVDVGRVNLWFGCHALSSPESACMWALRSFSFGEYVRVQYWVGCLRRWNFW